MIQIPTDAVPVVVIEGDCLDVLRQLPTGCVDAVVTDPPYGMNALDGTRTLNRYGISRRDNWDCQPIGKREVDLMLAAGSQCIIWGMNYFCKYLPPHKGFLVWNKPHVAHLPTRSAAELAFTNLEQPARAISMVQDSDLLHPAQKPVALMRWCIEMTTGIILDPFAGSKFRADSRQGSRPATSDTTTPSAAPIRM